MTDEIAKRSKAEYDLEKFLEERQAVGGLDIKKLKEQNIELEEHNRILRTQQKTVVTYNKEFGTMEYIGDPVPLDYKRRDNKP